MRITVFLAAALVALILTARYTREAPESSPAPNAHAAPVPGRAQLTPDPITAPTDEPAPPPTPSAPAPSVNPNDLSGGYYGRHLLELHECPLPPERLRISIVKPSGGVHVQSFGFGERRIATLIQAAFEGHLRGPDGVATIPAARELEWAATDFITWHCHEAIRAKAQFKALLLDRYRTPYDLPEGDDPAIDAARRKRDETIAWLWEDLRWRGAHL